MAQHNGKTAIPQRTNMEAAGPIALGCNVSSNALQAMLLSLTVSYSRVLTVFVVLARSEVIREDLWVLLEELGEVSVAGGILAVSEYQAVDREGSQLAELSGALVDVLDQAELGKEAGEEEAILNRVHELVGKLMSHADFLTKDDELASLNQAG